MNSIRTNRIGHLAIATLFATALSGFGQLALKPVHQGNVIIGGGLRPVVVPKAQTSAPPVGEVTYTPLDGNRLQSTASPISLDPVSVSDGAGEAFVLKGKFPKNTLVQLQFSKTLDGDWMSLGSEELLLDGYAEVTAPDLGDQCYFRLDHRPMPVLELLTEERKLLETKEPVSNSLLDHFVRGSFGGASIGVEEGSKFVPAGEISIAGTAFDWGKTIVPLTQAAPNLSAMGNNELVESMTRKAQESWTLPMVWSVANTKAKSASWAIQMEPFSNTAAYETAWLALTGEVNMKDLGDGPQMIQFGLDFSQISILGLDYGKTAYARIWEKRADGTHGPGSNVFAFTVEAAPSTVTSGSRDDWTIPEGTLKLTHPYLGCIETTDGNGSDQTLAAAYVLNFGDDGVTVEKLLGGAADFDPGDDSDGFGDGAILSFTGPEFPDNRDTWVVYLLDELDEDEWVQVMNLGLLRGQYLEKEIPTTNEVAHRSSQLWNLIKDVDELVVGSVTVDVPDTPGGKQSLVCQMVRNFITELVADRTVSEVFASTHFRVGDSHIEKALSTGRYKRSINLQGDGAEYFAEFQLDWIPK